MRDYNSSEPLNQVLPYIAMGNNPVMGVDPDGGYWNTHQGASTWVGDSWHRQLKEKLYWEATWQENYNNQVSIFPNNYYYENTTAVFTTAAIKQKNN